MGENSQDSELYKKLRSEYKNKNIYLFIRFAVYFLLTIISINGLYEDKNVTSTMYFDTLFLFSLPLLIEYCFQFNVYGKPAMVSKYVGLFVSGTIAAISFISLMGKGSVKFNNNEMQQVLFMGKNIIDVIKKLPYVSVTITFADCILSLGKDEIVFFGVQSKIKEIAMDVIKEDKVEQILKEKSYLIEKYNARIAEIIAKK